MESSSMPTAEPSETTSALEPRVSVVPSELNQALLEFELMFRYVLSEGLELDDQTRKDVIEIQRLLSESKKTKVVSPDPAPTVAVAPEPSFAHTEDAPVPVAAPTQPDFADALLKTHGALAKLISPATPLSLAATEPGRFGYLSNPPLIRWMIFIALFSVVGFLMTSIVLGNSKP